MLQKIPLNRESHVYSCISENSAVNEGIVKSGHRIELLIITNVYLWKKMTRKKTVLSDYLLASLTKVTRMTLELSVKSDCLYLEGVSFNCLICGQYIDTASTKINRNLRRTEVTEEQEKEKKLAHSAVDFIS